MIISKEMFVACILAIQRQEEYDHKCIDAFQTILNEDRIVIGYDNSVLSTQIINLLVACMNDNGQWIEYFIYDLDYGKEYHEGSVMQKDKTPIDISTEEKLYDFLKDEYLNS